MSLASPDRFYAMFVARRVCLHMYQTRSNQTTIPEKIVSDWWSVVGEAINLKSTRVASDEDIMSVLARILPLSWHQDVKLCLNHFDELNQTQGVCFLLYIMAAVRGPTEMKFVIDEIDRKTGEFDSTFKTFLDWLRFIYLNITQQTAVMFTGFMQYLFENNIVTSWEKAAIFGGYIGAIMGSTRLHSDPTFNATLQQIQLIEKVDYAALINNLIQISPKQVLPRVTYPMTEGYTLPDVTAKRRRIFTEITSHIPENFDTFDEKLVNVLLQLYNDEFFDHQLFTTLADKKLTLSVTLDDRSVSSVGCMHFGQNERILVINRPIILGTFRRGEQFHCSNGLKWTTRMECLMSTIEHELIHVLLDVWDCTQDSSSKIYSHHGLLFQQVAKAYFGHTDFYHAFDIDGAIIKSKEDFTLGQIVNYLDDKKVLSPSDGKIIKLNKRTVKLEVVGAAEEKTVVKIPYSCVLVKS